MAQMEKTTVYLPVELERELKHASRRQGRPMAEIVREAVRRYLDEQPRPMPKSIGMGADGRIGADRSKRWVRSEWDRRWRADA